MEETPRNLRFWNHDPILKLIKETLRFSDVLLVFYAVVISAIILFGFGWIADSSYTGTGLRMFEMQSFFFALAFTFIFMPFIFAFYAWQPQAFARVLHSLQRNEVVKDVSESGLQFVKSYEDFVTRFQTAVDRKLWILVVMISLVAFWSIVFFVSWPSEFRALGRSTFWYDTKWFLVMAVLLYSTWLYALSMIIIREIIAVTHFSRLFTWFHIVIHPIHPDEAGGLGTLGSLTLRTSLVAVGLGVLAVIYSIQIWLAGGSLTTRPEAVFIWTIYLVVTPISVILPMLSAHKAMKEFKNGRLEEISEEFESILLKSTVSENMQKDKLDESESILDAPSQIYLLRQVHSRAKNTRRHRHILSSLQLDLDVSRDPTKRRATHIKEDNETLSELNNRYNIVATSYPSWPVSTRLFRNVSITAFVPLITGLISLAVRLIIK